MWFAGNHGDVGGGWADDDGLADITLRFMATRAMQKGLPLDETKIPAGEVTGREKVHHADESDFKKFGKKDRERSANWRGGKQVRLPEKGGQLIRGPWPGS